MSSQEHSGPSTRGPPRRRPHGGCLGPLSSLGAPVARRAQRQAWLARCKHLSVRRHAANVQRRLAGLRAAGLAAARVAMSAHTARWRRVLLSFAAGVCAAACAGRRKRRLLQAGRAAARARLADGRGGRGRGGGCCGWTSRRRTAGSAAPTWPLAVPSSSGGVAGGGGAGGGAETAAARTLPTTASEPSGPVSAPLSRAGPSCRPVYAWRLADTLRLRPHDFGRALG